MGFCNNCGCEINTEKFCPKCGTATSGDERTNTMAELERLINYFKQKEGAQTLLIAYTKQIKELESKGYWISLIFSIVWTVWGVKELFIDNGISAETIFLFVFFALPGAVVFLVRRKLISKNEQKIEIAKEEKSKLLEELLEHYNKCERCPIGFELATPDYLGILYEYVRKSKASTIQGAMKCLDEDLHREKMETMAREALDKANEAVDRAKSAEKSADRAEWNTYRQYH